MKIFLQFFSMTIGAQICLALNQLVLLPLQLRVWGHVGTAHWFVVMALANLCLVADLGLSSAGHAQLVLSVRSQDSAAAAYFRQIWAMTRGVMFGYVLFVLLGEGIAISLEGGVVALWPFVLIITLAFDALIIIRGNWLDSLGEFRKVEGLFLAMNVMRTLMSIVALVLFHSGPAGLAYMMLITGIGTITAQTVVLRKPDSLHILAPIWCDIRWHTVRVIPLAVADPASTWIRFGLPVIVLASISGPETLTVFVAMRALFSIGRQVIKQLSRFASIRYAEDVTRDATRADAMLGGFILLATLAACLVSCAIIADHGRLLGLWLDVPDTRLISWITLSFAGGAAGNSFQVIAAVQMRTGKIKRVAQCQYAYIAASLCGAAIGSWVGSTPLYLALLSLQEILIGLVFALCLRERLFWLNAGAVAVGFTVTIMFGLSVNLGLSQAFTAKTFVAAGEGLASGGGCVLFIILAYMAIYELTFGFNWLRHRRS